MKGRYKKVAGQRLLPGILLSAAMLVSGCSTMDSSQYRVSLEKSRPRTVLVGEDGKEIAGAAEADSGVQEYLSYGQESRIGWPRKSEFSKEQGEYSLDFVGVAISEFVAIVFNDLLGTNYVLDKAVKGDVTVQTRGKINRQQLLSIVESVLAIHGAAMIERDGRFEILPLSKARNYSLTPEIFSSRNLKPGYRMVIIPVNHINPDDLKPVLDVVSANAGHLKIDKARGAIVVTGDRQVINSVANIVRVFDVDWLGKKSLGILPVTHVPARDMKTELMKILKSQEGEKGVAIDTLDRFNALLVVAEKKKELDAVRKWLKMLDKPVPESGAQLFVYKVQNRKANELAEMLNNIFSDQPAGPAAAKAATAEKIASDKKVVLTGKAAESTKTPEKGGFSLGNADVRIVADDANNSILILCSRAQYEGILPVVKKLDALPLQVLIEVSIVEVTLTDELSYGLEWYLKHNDISNTYDSETLLDLNASAGIGPVAPGFSFLLSGSGALVKAVFNTLASESKLNVISSPSLMALDNHTATIRVGDQQPVQVSSSKSTNNDVLTQSIEYKNTGVLLSVTPRVNSGGLVTMELSQEVTDIGGIDKATGQRSFLQRNINSTVAVQDGQTIILGGLITENSANAESGIPGAYKWPILGGLFGKKTRSKVKRELIVLITPRVIYNHQFALDETREYAEKMDLLKSSLVIQQ